MAKKRVLIFTNHFFPETFKVNDIAFNLVARGDEVTVVTGIPNYPKGHFFDGYGIFKNSRETLNGVRVIRLPLIPRGKGGSLRLIINYISYLVSLMLYLPFLFFNKYDTVFVHHTSPIFIGIPAVLYKNIRNTKLFFWNLDLWPESVTAASEIDNRLIIGFLNKLVKWIYNNCDVILISSKNFEKAIRSKLRYDIPIAYLPNWADDINTIDNYELPEIPDTGLNIMFAGNMGDAQDFGSILEAIVKLKESKINWIFLGDGRKREWFLSKVKENSVEKNVYWLGRHPIETMPLFYRKADVMLVSLKNEKIFSLTLPAKVQSYMVCAKPIIGMISGEGSDIINMARCGYSSNSGDMGAFVENIEKLASLPKENLIEMGQNGLDFCNKNFKKEILLEKLFNLIHS